MTFEARIAAVLLSQGCTQDQVDDLLALFCLLNKGKTDKAALSNAALIKLICP